MLFLFQIKKNIQGNSEYSLYNFPNIYRFYAYSVCDLIRGPMKIRMSNITKQLFATKMFSSTEK